jgi:hypothetical protein
MAEMEGKSRTEKRRGHARNFQPGPTEYEEYVMGTPFQK